MINLDSIKALRDHPNTPPHEREAARVAYDRLIKNPKIAAKELDNMKWMKDRYDELMKLSKVKTFKIGVGFTMETFQDFEINLDSNGRV